MTETTSQGFRIVSSLIHSKYLRISSVIVLTPRAAENPADYTRVSCILPSLQYRYSIYSI